MAKILTIDTNLLEGEFYPKMGAWYFEIRKGTTDGVVRMNLTMTEDSTAEIYGGQFTDSEGNNASSITTLSPDVKTYYFRMTDSKGYIQILKANAILCVGNSANVPFIANSGNEALPYSIVDASFLPPNITFLILGGGNIMKGNIANLTRLKSAAYVILSPSGNKYNEQLYYGTLEAPLSSKLKLFGINSNTINSKKCVVNTSAFSKITGLSDFGITGNSTTVVGKWSDLKNDYINLSCNTKLSGSFADISPKVIKLVASYDNSISGDLSDLTVTTSHIYLGKCTSVRYSKTKEWAGSFSTLQLTENVFSSKEVDLLFSDLIKVGYWFAGASISFSMTEELSATAADIIKQLNAKNVVVTIYNK